LKFYLLRILYHLHEDFSIRFKKNIEKAYLGLAKGVAVQIPLAEGGKQKRKPP